LKCILLSAGSALAGIAGLMLCIFVLALWALNHCTPPNCL